MINISQEQLDVSQTLIINNVVVCAVPGSGKTHTCLHISQAFADKKCLLLTYNSRLKDSVRDKAPINLEVHSYHSFSNKYYLETRTDSDIERAIKIFGNKSGDLSPKYDIILIDEAQDITPLYYRFLRIVFDNCLVDAINSRVCIFGDHMQELYAFKGADSRYLTLASSAFGYLKTPFVSRALSISYRLTREITQFISQSLLGGTREINAVKSGIRPRYCIINAFDSARIYQYIFLPLLQKYGPNEIFILAYSVTQRENNQLSPIAKFANEVSGRGLNIAVIDQFDSAASREKICFSTFHQTKGLERKAVIIFGFDERGFPSEKCPSELYVACSRASEELVVIHHKNNDFPRFLARDTLSVRFYGQCKPYKISENVAKSVNFSVTNFVKFLDSEFMDNLISNLDITVVRKPSTRIAIVSSARQVNTTEIIADINGCAIPAYYELCLTGAMSIGEFSPAARIQYMRGDLSHEETSSEVLRVATKFAAESSGYLYKLRQISQFNWMSFDVLDKCRHRLDVAINGVCCDNNMRFERAVYCDFLGFPLSGRIDAITDASIFEFKCVGALTAEHILQVAMYLMITADSANYRAFLYNIIDDNLLEIRENQSKLSLRGIAANIYEKKLSNFRVSDLEFIAKILT